VIVLPYTIVYALLYVLHLYSGRTVGVFIRGVIREVNSMCDRKARCRACLAVG
jgi:hypothetical protein